jgi:hypothetical protein
MIQEVSSRLQQQHPTHTKIELATWSEVGIESKPG